MKYIFLLVICLKLLIEGRVFGDENEIIRSLTDDIVEELSENVERNERFVRHVQVVTETAIQHVLKNIRTKFEKRNLTSPSDRRRASRVITKKLQQLEKKMRRKKSKKYNSRTTRSM